jgi:transposase
MAPMFADPAWVSRRARRTTATDKTRAITGACTTDIMGVSARAMLQALIDDERDPQVLAELAKGRLRVKRAALIEALTGPFDEHHAELADLLLSQIAALSTEIEHLDTRIEQLIADIPAAAAPAVASAGDGQNDTPPAYLGALDRLDEITGIGRHAAQAIIAEVGLSMAIFPTAGHLVSWAKLSPRAIQSGTKTRAGKTGKGNRYLKSVLGEAAAVAARSNTYLGARYRRLARRIGKAKALVAVARSILVIVWQLLADPTTRYHDLGPDYFDNHQRTERRKNNHVRRLEALGYKVTLEPAAA